MIEEINQDDGMLITFPNGSGWNIHIEPNGEVVVEGPIVLIS